MCEACAVKYSGEEGTSLTANDFQQNRDPSICQWCDADAGSQAHGELAELPICESCESRLRNWPFPAWIKIAFVVLVVTGACSFVYNYRHVDAYLSSRAAGRNFKAGDLKTAQLQARRAATLVPTYLNYRIQADLFEGIWLLNEDKSAEALQKLNQLDPQVRNLPMVQVAVRAAEIAVAFDNKDYDRFLELAKQQSTNSPDNRQSQYQIASAYACKYADTGNDEFKQSALAQLATVGDDQSDEERLYRERIMHRLATRRILHRHDYLREFPNGWKPEE